MVFFFSGPWKSTIMRFRGVATFTTGLPYADNNGDGEKKRMVSLSGTIPYVTSGLSSGWITTVTWCATVCMVVPAAAVPVRKIQMISVGFKKLIISFSIPGAHGSTGNAETGSQALAPGYSTVITRVSALSKLRITILSPNVILKFFHGLNGTA